MRYGPDRIPAALALILALAPPVLAEPGKADAVPACPSLANYRMLMREVNDDARAAAVRLADPKAEHLGCATVARERIAGLADHVTLEGRSYDCLALRATSLCYWVRAGSAAPADAALPARKSGPEKGRH